MWLLSMRSLHSSVLHLGFCQYFWTFSKLAVVHTRWCIAKGFVRRLWELWKESKRKDPDLNIKIHVTFSFEPYVSDINTKFAKTVQKAVESVYNEEREFKLFISANDAHWFQEREIETILMGIGNHKNNVHAEDEFVDIEDLIDTTKIFAITALNYLKW